MVGEKRGWDDGDVELDVLRGAAGDGASCVVGCTVVMEVSGVYTERCITLWSKLLRCGDKAHAKALKGHKMDAKDCAAGGVVEWGCCAAYMRRS